MALSWLDRIRGSPVSADLHRYSADLHDINALEREVALCTDPDLASQASTLTSLPLRERRVRCYALAREAARRALSLRPYDVQVLAALAMDDGRVVEMQTGEGKTLAAVLPAALNALTGTGVHVLTFNDYLARRDAEWMGPVFARLGLHAAHVEERMSSHQRRQSYRADVTYVTAKEAGFDFLRDSLVLDASSTAHRPFHFALIDEADSILIDEARVPLVIAGAVDHERGTLPDLARLVADLRAGVDFDTDEYQRNVELTERGIERVEKALGRGSLHDEHNLTLLTQVNCALHARVLLRCDVDYIVRDGRVQIVDELTGRVVHDRHWPDGLQAAVEVKEGLECQGDGRILGSITLQHFLRHYPRLCGMTGTAVAAAEELQDSFGLGVTVIPTNAPMIRVDEPDVVFTHRAAKEDAVVAEIVRAHTTKRPVLVGTLTVEESERLAERLRAAGLPCSVLNAKHDADEALVIAGAGALGAITISTNMAGRGTDIRLGGPAERDRDYVVAAGGLYVIGTNRHETRRVDLQLRGRAGRQGDPGQSRFFVSLEDDLLVRFGIRELIPAQYMPAPAPDPIDSPVIRGEIARAQRIVEGQNHEIRTTLERYAGVVEDQRKHVAARRQRVLSDQPLSERTGELRLLALDRVWRDHLAFCADLREGIHLMSLGGIDPLTHFTNEAVQAFRDFDVDVDEEFAAAERGEIELKGPTATWTYLVNDDPFKNQILTRLVGPAKNTLTLWAALFVSPLLILWLLADRLASKKRRAKRGSRGEPPA